MVYNGETTQPNEFKRIDAFLQMTLEGIQIEELIYFLKEIDSSIQILKKS